MNNKERLLELLVQAETLAQELKDSGIDLTFDGYDFYSRSSDGHIAINTLALIVLSTYNGNWEIFLRDAKSKSHWYPAKWPNVPSYISNNMWALEAWFHELFGMDFCKVRFTPPDKTSGQLDYWDAPNETSIYWFLYAKCRLPISNLIEMVEKIEIADTAETEGGE